jgi:hypothetical protein
MQQERLLLHARRYLAVARAGWLLPLGAGLLCYLVWLVTGSGSLPFLGMSVIPFGLIGMLIGWVYCSRARAALILIHAGPDPDAWARAARLRRAVRAVGLLLPLNILAAILVIYAVFSFGRPTTVTVCNDSPNTISGVSWTLGYARSSAPHEIPPGGSFTDRAWVPPAHSGLFVLRTRHVEQHVFYRFDQGWAAPWTLPVRIRICPDGRPVSDLPQWTLHDHPRPH